MIVTVDWATYPADYLLGDWHGEVDDVHFEGIFEYADLLVSQEPRDTGLAKGCSAEVPRISTPGV